MPSVKHFTSSNLHSTQFSTHIQAPTSPQTTKKPQYLLKPVVQLNIRNALSSEETNIMVCPHLHIQMRKQSVKSNSTVVQWKFYTNIEEFSNKGLNHCLRIYHFSLSYGILADIMAYISISQTEY